MQQDYDYIRIYSKRRVKWICRYIKSKKLSSHTRDVGSESLVCFVIRKIKFTQGRKEINQIVVTVAATTSSSSSSSASTRQELHSLNYLKRHHDICLMRQLIEYPIPRTRKAFECAFNGYALCSVKCISFFLFRVTSRGSELLCEGNFKGI